MHSLLINGRTGRAVMGGLQDKLIDFDVTSSKQYAVLNDIPDGTNAILRDHSRFVVSGDVPSGRVHLRDPLTLKVVHTVDAHSGVLSDLDVHGHHLVTCGSHAAARAPDRFLMVYDLRMIKAISPIQVMLGKNFKLAAFFFLSKLILFQYPTSCDSCHPCPRVSWFCPV